MHSKVVRFLHPAHHPTCMPILFSLGHHRLWSCGAYRCHLFGPGQSPTRSLRGFYGQWFCCRWSTDHNYRRCACSPLPPSIFVFHIFNHPQLKTSPVSPEASSVQNSWISSARNPFGSVQPSSLKPSLVSIFLPVPSDTGVRVRKTKRPRRLILSLSLPVPAQSVWASGAKMFIGRVASAHVPFVTVPFPSSGTNPWPSLVVVIQLQKRLHVNYHDSHTLLYLTFVFPS